MFEQLIRNIGPFTFTVNTTSGWKYFLYYLKDKTQIYSYTTEEINRLTLSRAALIWVHKTNKNSDELIKLVTESTDRKIWIRLMGDKYPIPEEWYIEETIRGV